MNRKLLVGILVALVIVVVLAIAVPRLRHDDRQLSGLWVGTPEFLDQAGLSDMFLLLEPAEGATRAGHLVMIGADGETVANQSVDITWRPDLARWAGAVREHFVGVPRAEKVFVEYEDDEDELMPTELTLTHDTAAGTLGLHDGSTLFAHLARDGLASRAN